MEEIPAYQPSGSGEHLFLLVEKRELSTPHLIGRIKRTFGLDPRQVGHAGLKDADAVTRQWLSVHTSHDLPLERLDGEDLRVLSVHRHHNKLRPGHLRGNRFVIRIAEAHPPQAFDTIVDALRREGFPNYFGPQRLGNHGHNVRHGRRLVLGEAPPRGPSERLRFYANAYQAALFNLLLSWRLESVGTLGRILCGDLAVRHASGGSFSVTEAERESAQGRADEAEISPSAPLFGYKVPLAQGVPGEWERALLRREGLEPEAFRFKRKRLSARGERRPVRAFPSDLEWRAVEDGVEVRFTLPPGTYATALLRELMKNDDFHDVLHGEA